LLDAAREACGPLEADEQEDTNILDTAATFHERLADLAAAQGDKSAARAEQKLALAIRARIEALGEGSEETR